MYAGMPVTRRGKILPEDLDHLDNSRFGVIEREGKKLYRFRAKDYRIYFEKRDEGITVHRILHKNTLRDFLFRSKLPTSEDAQLEKQSKASRVRQSVTSLFGLTEDEGGEAEEEEAAPTEAKE